MGEGIRAAGRGVEGSRVVKEGRDKVRRNTGVPNIEGYRVRATLAEAIVSYGGSDWGSRFQEVGVVFEEENNKPVNGG